MQVHAASVNLLDAKIKNGEFKLILPYRLPLILGHDVAGVVIRVGPRVRQFKPGDEVYARPDDFRIGAFAEYVAVKEESLAIKPKELSMEEAASIPLVGLTAWQALIERANLKKGQKVFIQAGSGGVGTFAIQLAKHVAATVATRTSTANIDLVKGLGADIVVDYSLTNQFTLALPFPLLDNTGHSQSKSAPASLSNRHGGLITNIPQPRMVSVQSSASIANSSLRILRIPVAMICRSKAIMALVSMSGYQMANIPVAQRLDATVSASAMRANSFARSKELSISTNPRRSGGGRKAFSA